MIGQLTTKIVSDATPLALNSQERLIAAANFIDSRDALQDLDYIYRNENKPPYYYAYKNNFHETSTALNQFAINDMMAFE